MKNTTRWFLVEEKGAHPFYSGKSRLVRQAVLQGYFYKRRKAYKRSLADNLQKKKF
jgi:hypothetical protein